MRAGMLIKKYISHKNISAKVLIPVSLYFCAPARASQRSAASRSRMLFCTCILVILCSCFPKLFAANDTGIASEEGEAFAGNNLHLTASEAITYELSTGEHILIFPAPASSDASRGVGQGKFSMSISNQQFSSDNAVIWLLPSSAEAVKSADAHWEAIVYLQGNVSAEKAGQPQMLGADKLMEDKQMVVRFVVNGEVLITADKKESTDPRGLELYTKAYNLIRAVDIELPSPEAEPEAVKLQQKLKEHPIVISSVEDENDASRKITSPTFLSSTEDTGAEKSSQAPTASSTGPGTTKKFDLDLKSPFFGPAGEIPFDFEYREDEQIATVIGRFYLWQKKEDGGLLELHADDAVIFLPEKKAGTNKEGLSGLDSFFEPGTIRAIYLSGDVVMTEGRRTIRADEIYYDFEQEKAIVINAQMRNFDVKAGIPIYIRAAKLRQLAENKFSAENITLTTSEFYLPQISLDAASVIITDNSEVEKEQNKGSKGDFDVQMHDVRMKYYGKTIFYLPYMRSNMQRPDVPIKSAHVGNDNTFGTYIETRWYLARLLGLAEPEGTDSTLALDYYSDRGFGGGIASEYEREDYFGRMLGYIINDDGKDRLGRNSSRKNLKPPHELRGRFRWQHRHFLPYSWQLTTEVSYISDKNFIESYYRDEFNVDKEQETLVYLKRIEDNWGLSFFGKVRLNDFMNELEELPTTEFHWTGQSFLDDKLTFYSDNQLSRFRQLYASDSTPIGSQEFFTFMTTRNEVDMPMSLGRTKIVPFVAGTVAYEDGMGFYRNLDGSTGVREDEVWFSETGIRISPQPFWKVFPRVESNLWDINQLRHIISPSLTAVGYTQSDSVIEQRDTLNVGISQRLQTKRGSGENERTVDWMRLDMDVTWVNNSGDASAGADQFIWNKPFIPLFNEFSTTIPQKDRRGSAIYGPRRNYFEADYIWRVTDTTAILSDMNYDMQSGVVQQYNVGFSRLRWPNLNYYIGSRYLRRIDNNYGEKGSNAVTFAFTYLLDPRYTLVYSGQFDFDYGATIRSDLTLIRRYHRLFWSVTFSTDESLDRQAVVISLWPQGVPDFAIGPSRYMGLGGSSGF